MNVKIAICAVFVTFGTIFSVQAEYNQDPYTIDNGGQASSGGKYVVMGTIAQHDAAYSQGGNYEILGGFWSRSPLCIIDFEDFANFAQYWLKSSTALPSDLVKDGTVDFYDLDAFVYEWLYPCPYSWPLK